MIYNVDSTTMILVEKMGTMLNIKNQTNIKMGIYFVQFSFIWKKNLLWIGLHATHFVLVYENLKNKVQIIFY